MNGTQRFSDGIADAVRRAARKFIGKSALVFEDRDWSYTALDQAADRVAFALLNAGLVAGDRVAAFGKNSDAYLITMLACARAGLIHVPINDNFLDGEFQYIIDHCKPGAIIYDADKAGVVEGLSSNGTVRLYGGFIDHAFSVLDIARIESGAAIAFSGVSRSDVAQIQYTSGTSGRPKGAVMSHGAMLSQYYSCIHELDYSDDDTILAALPLYHTAQMHAFSMPQLIAGSRTILLARPDIARMGQMIPDFGITSLFCPPTVWISLLAEAQEGRANLSSLRKCYYGAAIMPLAVLNDLIAVMPDAGFYNVYGQTEIAPVATVLRPDEHLGRPASVGRPVLNVETQIVDDAMREMPPRKHGEIVHRSPQLLDEYWADADGTSEAFRGGWFHSGDLGYKDEEGYIYLVDRIKDVIKTGGVMVSAREVEEVLFSCPAVQEAAVIAIPDAKWIEVVCAVIVLRKGCALTAAEAMDYCSTKLAKFKRPKRVLFVDALPKSAAGKILKREIRDSFPTIALK